MSVLIVGAGATGGYYGACLQQAGAEVTFLVRGRRAEQLRQRGLRVVRGETVDTVSTDVLLAGEITKPWDVVLVTVKAMGLRQAIQDFAPAVGPESIVIPVLNGMSHMDALNERFGAANVLGGVAKLVTHLRVDGDIVKMASLASLEVGTQDGGPDIRLDKAAATLDVPGYDFRRRPDIIAAMWHKWAFIATVGALTTLMQAPVGEILAVPGGRDFALAVMDEAEAVSAAAGYPVPEAEIDFTRNMITADGSPFASSMYRDLVGGSHVEVEPILGDMARRAVHLGVETPLLDLATMRLRIHENRLNRNAPLGLVDDDHRAVRPT